ncbi:helix-turn-helix domain-containing protein [Streptomyces sp. NPDC091281]|uniref:helix-turn-helix domain-containing protein n=1 Tax=Streptomyces sp. NPDC091281 TaxID=3365985 RepID=UPI00380AF62C
MTDTPGTTRRPRTPTPYGVTGHQVANNIGRLRKRRGLSVYALSDLVHRLGRQVSPDAVSKIEHCKRQVTVDDLSALAAALDVEPQYLLSPPPPCEACKGAPHPGFTCNTCGVSA